MKDNSRGLDQKHILNPQSGEKYGSVTKFLAIDCEMDQIRTTENGMVICGTNIPCKVSIVNAEGIVVLDTLIKPSYHGVDIADITQVPGYKCLDSIHGINPEWLVDAPSFSDVREHIMELCGKLPELTDCIKEDS